MSNVISRIHDLFIAEAHQSPLLFNDLASMENYISESYSGRSIIELLQNADDAKAGKIIFKYLTEDVYIAANDGRVFTDDDLISLCRSGASNKRRNSDTIGYRGIGFKSVVNYAKTVHLISGDIRTTFSREMTRDELFNSDKVPLIRVPHNFTGDIYSDEIDNLLNEGYNSIFIFEVKNDAFTREIEGFTADSLVFLNNIKNVMTYTEQIARYTVIRDNVDDSKRNVEILYNDRGRKKWLVIENKERCSRASLAFKMENGIVIPAERDESVIHSFLPTNDRLSIRFKINGDFSTDPSRTRIVQDEATDIANKKCAELIAEVFNDILNSESDKYGITMVLKDASIDPLSKIKGERANDIIIAALKSEIMKIIRLYADGRGVFLQPKGITDEDFENIIMKLGAKGIGNSQESRIKGIMLFLHNMGVEELSSDDCLSVMKDMECSNTTRSTVLARTIKNTRLFMTEKQKELITNAKLFSFVDGIKSIKSSNGSKVTEAFEGSVIEQLATIADYTGFAKKIGLDENQLAGRSQQNRFEHIITGIETMVSMDEFKTNRVIKKWRSVEQNVAAVLELMDDVRRVKDVTEQNIGYDIETILKNGNKRYYEVKSVSYMGETVSFSNNEYSTCVSLKNDYYLAIAVQTDKDITICFIKNPVEALHFTKRITRWDWMCSEYKGEVITTKMK